MKYTHHRVWLRISVQYMVAIFIIYFVIAIRGYAFMRPTIGFHINDTCKH